MHPLHPLRNNPALLQLALTNDGTRFQAPLTTVEFFKECLLFHRLVGLYPGVNGRARIECVLFLLLLVVPLLPCAPLHFMTDQ